MKDLAWVTGAAVMLGGAMPSQDTIVLALLFSLGAHGIMTLNDFKAVQGDAPHGRAFFAGANGRDQSGLDRLRLHAGGAVGGGVALLMHWGSPNAMPWPWCC
jgi:chlorophyll/bacteriochlorophyll a synthase